MVKYNYEKKLNPVPNELSLTMRDDQKVRIQNVLRSRVFFFSNVAPLLDRWDHSEQNERFGVSVPARFCVRVLIRFLSLKVKNQ